MSYRNQNQTKNMSEFDSIYSRYNKMELDPEFFLSFGSAKKPSRQEEEKDMNIIVMQL